MSSLAYWFLSVVKDAGARLLGGALAAAAALWLASRGIRPDEYLHYLLELLFAPEHRMAAIAVGTISGLAVLCGIAVVVVRWGGRRGYPSTTITRLIRQRARELEAHCLSPLPSPNAEAVLAMFRDQLAEVSSFGRLAPLMIDVADETDQYMIACTPGSNLDDHAERHRTAAVAALHRLRKRTAWVVNVDETESTPSAQADVPT
jgi:hypothetical protein